MTVSEPSQVRGEVGHQASITDAFIDAAARGVEVVIITRGGEAPELRFKWDHKEYRDCAVSKFRGAGFELIVVDMDGDASWWELRRGKEKLAKGEVWDCQPYYHFDAALLQAEAALMSEARNRRALLSSTRKDERA